MSTGKIKSNGIEWNFFAIGRFYSCSRRLPLLCHRLELFGGELLAVDGSKFQAVNARDQNFNAAKLQDLIDRADARHAV